MRSTPIWFNERGTHSVHLWSCQSTPATAERSPVCLLEAEPYGPSPQRTTFRASRSSAQPIAVSVRCLRVVNDVPSVVSVAMITTLARPGANVPVLGDIVSPQLVLVHGSPGVDPVPLAVLPFRCWT